MDIFTLFLRLLHYVGWKFFSLISWWGVDFRWWKFLQIFGRIAKTTATTICLQKIFTWANWMEKLLSYTLFVYLFTYLFIYLFIIYLLIYLLFIYFKAAVYKVMHQFCGWVPLGGAISIKLCSNFSEIALAHFAVLRGFAAGCDEQLAFFFNLLLSLFISIKTVVKYTFYV